MNESWEVDRMRIETDMEELETVVDEHDCDPDSCSNRLAHGSLEVSYNTALYLLENLRPAELKLWWVGWVIPKTHEAERQNKHMQGWCTGKNDVHSFWVGGAWASDAEGAFRVILGCHPNAMSYSPTVVVHEGPGDFVPSKRFLEVFPGWSLKRPTD